MTYYHSPAHEVHMTVALKFPNGSQLQGFTQGSSDGNQDPGHQHTGFSVVGKLQQASWRGGKGMSCKGALPPVKPKMEGPGVEQQNWSELPGGVVLGYSLED